MNVRQSVCAEILDDEDLEDGEIFEDEEPNNAKSCNAEPKEKEKPIKSVSEGQPVQKKVIEQLEKNHRDIEISDKPSREQIVPFLNKGKRKQPFDDHEDSRWKRDGSKRNRRSHDLEREGERPGDDDEELMLVRGASPNSRLEEDLDKWARDGEEIERNEERRRPARSFRGRGGVGRRGERQRGRGRGGRGSLRGGKRKRGDDGETCHFFLQGKCQRGSECPYSHDILPPRKMELCKFFMKDCCAKKDKCLYMHSEFPCKYYHLGLKCYANKKCKFNHGVLTDTLKSILMKHLDSAPKDILGEFPRREGRERDRGEMRDRDLRGDSREMRGDPRDMRGDLRDMRGDPRDMRGDLRDMRGDPRDMRGDPRDMRGDPRDMRGDPRDMRGDPRDMRGDPRDLRGDPRDLRGDVRDLRADPRDMRIDPRDVRGDNRDMRGDSRDIRDDPREMRGEHRDSRESRDSRDLRELLRNRNERDRRSLSQFDIKAATPDDMRTGDGNSTPMPSPTQRSQDSMRSNDRDRDYYSPDREREKGKEKERDHERGHERHKHEKSERSKERRAKRDKAREHKKERKERREKEREKRREAKEKHDEKTANKTDDKLSEIMSPNAEDQILNIAEVPIPTDRNAEDLEKRGTLSEENCLFPQHLPKKQRELFLRIQQQQREAESSQASANDDEDNIAEENWYSSDEETPPSTSLPSILHNLTQSTGGTSSATSTMTTTNSSTPSSLTMAPLLNFLASTATSSKPSDDHNITASAPLIPPNLDLSDLSSVVFEALAKLRASSATTTTTTQQESTASTTTSVVKPELPPVLPKPEPPKVEPLRVRDPRLRLEAGQVENQRRSSSESYSSDMDLRVKSLSVTKTQPTQSGDVDLRNLPFKPVQHTAACEIDASLSSHPPISWELTPITVPKTDYTSLQMQPRAGVNDPRIRRMVRAVPDDSSSARDPRHRLIDEPVRDPRARQPLLATPAMPTSPLLSGPPPTPRYDEDHRIQFYHMDSDMRQFPPPTPRLEDEVYTPGPSRPVDPRQRAFSIDDPRNPRNHFPGRPDDTDLRTQMTRVPYVNYSK